MDEKSLKPQLRFKGFADAWEQRKLSEIASYLPSNLSASNTDINGRFDLYDANGVIGKTNAMPQKESYITIIKDGSGVGRVRMLPPQTCYIGTMGGIFSKATNNIDFIFHTLSNFDFSTHIIGATIPHVYFSDYGNDEIGVPYEAEQKMIGKFFSNLDNLITLHQRKLDKLSNVKKALLEKMFPKNDSDVPEIRFKGFTDAWEQRKLGDCAFYRRGSFPQPYGKKEWYDGIGAMPFVQVADVTDAMNLVNDTKQKISKLAQPMSVFAEKNSVLVTLQGTIGRVAITQYGAFVDRTVLIFEKYKDKINTAFWAYIIKQKFINEAKKAPGGTIKTITKETLSSFDLQLPKFGEQEKVGVFFSNLDNLITLHQRKLEKLKNIKKACLEKMFV